MVLQALSARACQSTAGHTSTYSQTVKDHIYRVIKKCVYKLLGADFLHQSKKEINKDRNKERNKERKCGLVPSPALFPKSIF